MPSFADRLREEIEYIGISQRELAEKAGIKKRALDMYLGYRESMPAVDVAVKLAEVLNVSVEYLVTGKTPMHKRECAKISKYKKIEDDLTFLTPRVLESVENMIHSLAEREKLLQADNSKKNPENIPDGVFV